MLRMFWRMLILFCSCATHFIYLTDYQLQLHSETNKTASLKAAWVLWCARPALWKTQLPSSQVYTCGLIFWKFCIAWSVNIFSLQTAERVHLQNKGVNINFFSSQGAAIVKLYSHLAAFNNNITMCHYPESLFFSSFFYHLNSFIKACLICFPLFQKNQTGL